MKIKESNELKPGQLPTVDIIASGYEWYCPVCDERNQQAGYTPIVVCHACGLECQANDPDHAIG